MSRPFRFLELPPELRNCVYHHAFTEIHGLSPHHLTQANRQIARDSSVLFREKIRTLRIHLYTPGQLAGFRKWLAGDNADLSPNGPAFEFCFTDADAGHVLIRFERTEFSLADSYNDYIYMSTRLADPAKPITPFCRHLCALFYLWIHAMGLERALGYCDGFRDKMKDKILEGFLRFTAAFEGRQCCWITHRMVIFPQTRFPAQGEDVEKLFDFLTTLLSEKAGREWEKNDLERLAQHLFERSVQARVKNSYNRQFEEARKGLPGVDCAPAT